MSTCVYLGGNTDNVTLFLECNLKLASTTESHIKCNTLHYSETAKHCTVVPLYYYQQAVTFMVNVTKSPYKAVTFYMCYILRCTCYLKQINIKVKFILDLDKKVIFYPEKPWSKFIPDIMVSRYTLVCILYFKHLSVACLQMFG